jgi:hypothetical protein
VRLEQAPSLARRSAVDPHATNSAVSTLFTQTAGKTQDIAKERQMRRSIELDRLLENAVAAAIGVEAPHPYAPKKLRSFRPKAVTHGRHVQTLHRREHSRAAA